MSPIELNYPPIPDSKYSNKAETQENNLKINNVQMIDGLKDKINKSLKEIQELTIKIGEN